MNFNKIDRNFNIIMAILVIMTVVAGCLTASALNKGKIQPNSQVGIPINRNSFGCVQYRFKINDKIQDVWACPDGIETRTVKATYCDPVFKKYFCQVVYYKIFERNPYDN